MGSEKRTPRAGGIAAPELKAFVERIEKLEEEKKALADDVKSVYGEAKARGFDTKTIRKIIALRRIEPAERAEAEALLEIDLHALGMLPDSDDAQAA